MDLWRIVFMGTPEFAVPSLHALCDGDDPVVGVFTQPDKPTGRGMKEQFSPVKMAALERNLPVFQPTRLRFPEAQEALHALAPDLIVVAAYGQILPKSVLDLPVQGCLNIHASLLPRWRGAAPIHRALLAGDPISGITLMRMDIGLDTGPMLTHRELPITTDMTGGELHDRLAQLGAALLRESMPQLHQGAIPARPQPAGGITYANKLEKSDEVISWQAPAIIVRRQILALNPWPAAHTHIDGELLKIFRAELSSGQGEPGTLLALHPHGIEIACGTQSLILTELQSPGKRRMQADQWLRGRSLMPGIRLGSPALPVQEAQ